MMICFIAGPYRADTPEGVTENIAQARKVALDVWRAGHVALCPHLNSAHMEDDLRNNEDAWLQGAI